MARNKAMNQGVLPVSQPETDLVAAEVKITLSKANLAALDLLSPVTRVQATRDMIASLTAKRIAYLNDPKTVDRLARDAGNRSEFKITHYPKKNTLGVTGLGRKFPVCLYKSEWLALIAQIDAIESRVLEMADDEE